MKIGDIGVGEIFRYDGALFVVCEFDWDKEYYPSLCVARRNYKYDIGHIYNINEDRETDYVVKECRLKEFIPKGIDYEME